VKGNFAMANYTGKGAASTPSNAMNRFRQLRHTSIVQDCKRRVRTFTQVRKTFAQFGADSFQFQERDLPIIARLLEVHISPIAC
jgi:hypothetical protein